MPRRRAELDQVRAAWRYLIAPPLGAALAWAVHTGVVRPWPREAVPPVAEVLTDEPAGGTAGTR